MNLPRGKLIDTLKGGPDVLRRLLAGLSGRDFNGYIKVDLRREDADAHGVIILIGSRPVMSIYIWRQRIFGQPSLRPILRDTLDEECIIKVFLLPEGARTEMNSALQKFSSARINIGEFDLDRETRLVLGDPAGRPPEGAADGAPAGATAADVPAPAPGAHPDEAAALYASISQLGVDTTDLRRKEEELLRREVQLRTELESGKKERDKLRTEEENFHRMDDALNKLIKQRESENAGKEGQLARRISELQLQLDKRAEEVANREEEVRREIERLNGEKEEMKRREEKLLEMEKMFRRVLTNTEERLKRKEEDLVRKEEELEKVLRLKMRELEDLRAQAANAGKAGQVPVEFQRIEEALKIKEGTLRKKEGELEDRIKRFQQELSELEKRKAALETGPRPAAADLARHIPEEDDLRRLMKNLDALFDRLPEDAIDKFAGSADFELYEKLLTRLGLVKK